MFADEDTAQNDAGQASGEIADTDTSGSDASSTDDSAGDTGTDDGTGKEEGHDGNADDQGEAKKPGEPMIPKSRFDTVIGERNTARDEAMRLQGQVEYLAQMVSKSQSGKPVSEQQQDKAQTALDALIEAGTVKREDATQLQKIIDAMGYHRGDSKPDTRVEKLERTVEHLTKMLGDKADREEKDAALKEYGDIITADDLDAVMKDWANSRDPELKQAATSWSYGKIIKLAFHDKIVKNEVDKALKGKKSPPPPIEKKGNGKTPPKPEKEDFAWDPGNGETSMDALKRSILVETATDGE